MKKFGYFLFTLAIFALFAGGLAFTAEAAEDKWVLTGPARVNPNNEQTSFAGGGALDWWYPEERYEGKTLDYSVSETSMSKKDHEFDRGEYWNATFTASFTKPPSTLTPGETVTLPVTLSGSGSVTSGGGWQSSMTFGYNLNANVIKGSQQGINLDFKSVSANPSLVVPAPSAGGKLVISAYLWNCAACLVEWEYRAAIAEPEPAETVEPVVEPVKVEEVVVESPSAKAMEDKEEETIDHPCLGMVTKEEVAKMNSQPGGVSIIEHIRGTVEVFREGDNKWTPAKLFTILHPGEAIRTSGGGEARLIVKQILKPGDEAYIPLSIQERELHEQLARNAEAREAGGLPLLWGVMSSLGPNNPYDLDRYEPEYAWVAEDSEACIGEFINIEKERGFIDLIKGGIQMITKGWKNGTIFSVKAGTTVCGIRGSEIFVSYDPNEKKTDAFVIEGHMDVTNTETGEVKSLADNQKLAVAKSQLGEIEAMSREEWEGLAVEPEHNFKKDEPDQSTSTIPAESPDTILDAEETRAGTIEDIDESKGLNALLVLLAVIMIVIIGFFGFKKIKK